MVEKRNWSALWGMKCIHLNSLLWKMREQQRDVMRLQELQRIILTTTKPVSISPSLSIMSNEPMKVLKIRTHHTHSTSLK